MSTKSAKARPSKFSLTIQDRVQRNFLAVGEPRSQERASQVQHLWRLNLPDLSIHIPRTDKPAWFAWATRIPESASYWCSALGKVRPGERVVKALAPVGSDITDPFVIETAYKAAADRLRLGWEDGENHFASEKQRERDSEEERSRCTGKSSWVRSNSLVVWNCIFSVGEACW